MRIRRWGTTARPELTHRSESADLCEAEVLPVKALSLLHSHDRARLAVLPHVL